MRMSLRNRILPPLSDLSLPARIRSREVFPVPFGAMSATLSPSLMLGRQRYAFSAKNEAALRPGLEVSLTGQHTYFFNMLIFNQLQIHPC